MVCVRVAGSVSAGHVPLRQRVLGYQAHWKHNIINEAFLLKACCLYAHLNYLSWTGLQRTFDCLENEGTVRILVIIVSAHPHRF